MTKKVERLERNFYERMVRILTSPKIGWKLLRYLSMAFSIAIVGYGLVSFLTWIQDYYNMISNNPSFLEEISRTENIQAILQEFVKNINSNENMIATIVAFLTFPMMFIGLFSLGLSLSSLENRIQRFFFEKKSHRNR